jgi:hypothetical protein
MPPGKTNIGIRCAWADLRFELEIFGEKKSVLSLPGFEPGSSSTYLIQFPKYVISAPVFLAYGNYPSVMSFLDFRRVVHVD